MKTKAQIEILQERPKTQFGQRDFCIIQIQTNTSAINFLKNIVKTVRSYVSIGICPTDEKLYAYSYEYFCANVANKSTTMIFSWHFNDIWTGKSRLIKFQLMNNNINKNKSRNIVDPIMAEGLQVSSVLRYFEYLYSPKIEEKLVNAFLEIPFMPDNFSFDTFLENLIRITIQYPTIGKDYNAYSIASAMTKYLKITFNFIRDYGFIDKAVQILNRLFFQIDGFKFNRSLTTFYLQLATYSKKVDLAIIQILQNQLPSISKYYLGNCKGKKTKEGFEIVNCVSYQNKLQIWLWLGQSLAYKFQWEKSLNCFYNACKLLSQQKNLKAPFVKLVQINELLQWNIFHELQKHPLQNRVLQQKPNNAKLQYEVPCRKLQRFNNLIKNFMNLSEQQQLIMKSLIKFVEFYFHKNIVVKNRVIDIRTTLNHFRDFIIQHFQGFNEDFDELQQLPQKIQFHEITYRPVIQNDMESMAHIGLFQKPDDDEEVQEVGFQGQFHPTSSLRKSIDRKQRQQINPEHNSPSNIVKQAIQQNGTYSSKLVKNKRCFNSRFQSLLQLSLSLSRHFYYLKTNQLIVRGRYSSLKMNIYDGYLLAEGAKLFNAHKIEFEVRSWVLQFVFNSRDYYRCIEVMLILLVKAKQSNQSTKQYIKVIFNMLLSLINDYSQISQEKNSFKMPHWLRVQLHRAYTQDDKNFTQELKIVELKNKNSKQKYDSILKQIKIIIK